MKKIILYLLILTQLTALVSISRGEESRIPYEEITLPMPEELWLSSMCMEPDGAILALAQGAESNYSFLRWRAFDEMPEVTPLPSLGLHLSSMDIAPDGAILLRSYGEIPDKDAELETTSDINRDTYREIYVWLDDSLQEAGRFEMEYDWRSYSTIKALPGKRLATSSRSNGDVVIYDAAGEILHQTDSMSIEQIAADATTLYALGNGYIYRWSLDAFEKLPTKSMDWRYFGNIAVGLDGGLYMTDQSGIYELDLEAGKAIKRMDSIGLSMSDPDNYSPSFCVLPDGVFAMSLWASEVNPEGERVSQQTIVICQPMKDYANRTPFVITRMFSWSTPLEKAATRFQRAHPELAVEIRTLNDYQTGGMSLDDALRMINTELLAGGGGDILMVDRLPVKAMIGRGVLRDISHLVPDLGLLPGIAEGSKHTDGKVYAIPTEFGVQLLWGRAEAVDTIRTLPDFLNAPLRPDQSRLPSFVSMYSISSYISSCMRDFLDADGYFDPTSEDFIAFLETMYALRNDMEEMPDDYMKFYEAERIALRNGNIALYPETCFNFFNLSQYYTNFGESEARAILMPSMHAPGNTYQPQTLLSIPASAKNPELSEEFIRLIFSNDEPLQNHFVNFSTSEARLDQVFAAALESSKDKDQYSITVIEADGQEFEYYMPEEPFLRDIRALLDSVSVPEELDQTLFEFIMEELEPFFEGRVSAEEAGEAIKQRAWLYMHE